MRAFAIFGLFYTGLTCIVYGQQKINPYENYDSLRTEASKSILIENGSYLGGKINTDNIYIIRFDTLFLVSKYSVSVNYYSLDRQYSQNQLNKNSISSLKRSLKKLSALDYYKCSREKLRGSTKKIKKVEFKKDWAYTLDDKEGKFELRNKLLLWNDCTSFFSAIKERKLINRIFRNLEIP